MQLSENIDKIAVTAHSARESRQTVDSNPESCERKDWTNDRVFDPLYHATMIHDFDCSPLYVGQISVKQLFNIHSDLLGRNLLIGSRDGFLQE